MIDIFISSDDIYEHIHWGDEKFHNILNVRPELNDRVIILNGVSKAYSMTGWRIGYAAGNKEIIKKDEDSSITEHIMCFFCISSCNNRIK